MGFQGLSKGSVSERWIETGFERKHQWTDDSLRW
jgi:hypothetical protein